MRMRAGDSNPTLAVARSRYEAVRNTAVVLLGAIVLITLVLVLVTLERVSDQAETNRQILLNQEESRERSVQIVRDAIEELVGRQQTQTDIHDDAVLWRLRQIETLIARTHNTRSDVLRPSIHRTTTVRLPAPTPQPAPRPVCKRNGKSDKCR